MLFFKKKKKKKKEAEEGKEKKDQTKQRVPECTPANGEDTQAIEKTTLESEAELEELKSSVAERHQRVQKMAETVQHKIDSRQFKKKKEETEEEEEEEKQEQS
ncbi:MAG: hypothetical protein GTO63_00305 [Anaerolineae bacterium]|nr:hypothetical protein [Anaerolineae bacterium]NIN93440.1 hypothetical protein [Anaerolineae bacterium]NIQ76802.1 hypothetical protein [Anaerolineae bacterium]